MSWAVTGAFTSLFALGCGDDEGHATSDAVDPDALIVPVEASDEASLEIASDWRALPVFGTRRYMQLSSRDRGVGTAPVKFLSNGNRDLNNFVCKSADAELPAELVEPTYELAQCPEDYVRGHVLARAEGSGRLARLQLTMLSLQNKPADTEVLRIYLDDERSPLVQAPLSAVLDGSAGEIFAPPFGRGVTHALAWYYPVSFEKRLIVALDRLGPLDGIYYQVDVVEEDGHRAAKAQRSPKRDQAAALLDSIASGPLATENISLASMQSLSLQSGETRTVADLIGPGTIHAAWFAVPQASLPELASIVVRVHWDDESSPAIDLPLSTLYAAELEVPSEASLPLASRLENGRVRLELRLPMPYASHARWELSSNATTPITLDFGLDGEQSAPDSFGRLHAETQSSIGPTSEPYHPIADLVGPGRYIGTCLMLEGHALGNDAFTSAFNFLEGDERGMIDGEPALLGTGTEDFLDDDFYFEHGPFGFAFAQAWGRSEIASTDPAQGKVSACRWHVLGDAIDFQERFQLDLEIGPGEPSLLDRYRSVAFYYR